MSWSEYRDLTHVHQVVDTHPDKWLDGGDHTTQIDPISNKQWVHDTHDGHAASEQRARGYDAARVQNLVGWENLHGGNAEIAFFEPSTTVLDSMEKFAVPESERGRSWRGIIRDSSRIGRLPVIEAQKYDGALGELGRGEIERDIRESERRVAHRLFGREGRR